MVQVISNIYRKNFFLAVQLLLLITILFTSSDIYSRGKTKLSFWNLNYMNGFIGLESNYYYQNTILKTGFNEEQKSSQFNGSFALDTKSSIIHPNFIELELNALFRPGTRNDNFIVAPDQAAVTTAEQITFKANIFKQRLLSGSFNFNYDHSFVRRDFATNIENFRKNFGMFLNYRNYLANFNFNYTYDDWLQNELELNRFYASIIHSIDASISQSFNKNYDNKLDINYSDYSRIYSFNNLIIDNKTLDAKLTTKFLFNIPAPVRYLSLILYNNQVGYDSRSKMNIQQSFYTQLPYNFTINAGYNYNFLKVNQFSSNFNNVNFSLSHQLFNSLNSFLNYEYSNYKQNTFSETTGSFEFGFNYTKDISIGNINISYSYNRYDKSSESLTNVNSIFAEGHKLTDGNITLLNNPFVYKNTVVVTDIDNVLVYQEGFDYEIIERDEFFEIRRIAGGQIDNDGFVLVNYDYSINNSFKYNSPSHLFSVGLNLFSNFIQLSYSGVELSFDNLKNVQYQVLKIISQRILSLTFNYAGFSTGMEFDSFQSNIVPYESLKYFGQYDYLQKNFALFSLGANYRSLLLTAQNKKEIYMDVVGRAMFFLSMKTKLLFESSYQLQEGIGIDLNLLKFKTEYQANFRALQFSIGLELYYRNYIQEERKYLNGFITVQRSF